VSFAGFITFILVIWSAKNAFYVLKKKAASEQAEASSKLSPLTSNINTSGAID